MLPVSQTPDLPGLFRRARCVFFDCDGVLFDSNGFKLEAMHRALAGQPEAALAQMDAYWRDHGGDSRWSKFGHFFREISPVADVPGAVEAASERFGAHSLAAYEDHEPLPLALLVVRAAGPERAVVVSGASEAELCVVFAKKGLTSLFSAVLGSPRTKLDLVRDVLDQRGLAATQTLFFGDGAGDFHVARELGIPFVYLDELSEWPGARDAMRDAPWVMWANDWSELVAALELGGPPS